MDKNTRINISIHTTAKVVTKLTLQERCKVIVNFNPHHREGGDFIRIYIIRTLRISIHTTAKVVTYREGEKICKKIFQSTPPRRW